ncbi:MAG: hypothetical protein R3C01_00260 [Planctomycetaceae bacterium]
MASEEVGAAIARSDKRESEGRARVASLEANEAGKRATIRTAFPSFGEKDRNQRSSSTDPFLDQQTEVARVRPQAETATNRISFAEPKGRAPISDEQPRISPWDSNDTGLARSGADRATKRDRLAEIDTANASNNRPLSRIEQLREELNQQQRPSPPAAGGEGVATTGDVTTSSRKPLVEFNRNDRGYPLTMDDERSSLIDRQVIDRPAGRAELVAHEEAERRRVEGFDPVLNRRGPSDDELLDRRPGGEEPPLSTNRDRSQDALRDLGRVDERRSPMTDRQTLPERAIELPDNPTALRVQSLLAAAEWHIQNGELEQAYRNTITAQQLADSEGIVFVPGDRRPTEVSKEIWKRIDSGRNESSPSVEIRPTEQPSAGLADRTSRYADQSMRTSGPSIQPGRSSRTLLEEPVDVPGAPRVNSSPAIRPAQTVPSERVSPDIQPENSETPWGQFPHGGQQWREAQVQQPSAAATIAASTDQTSTAAELHHHSDSHPVAKPLHGTLPEQSQPEQNQPEQHRPVQPSSGIALAGLTSIDGPLSQDSLGREGVVHADVKTDEHLRQHAAVTAAGFEAPLPSAPTDVSLATVDPTVATGMDWEPIGMDPSELPELAVGSPDHSNAPPFPWSIAVVAGAVLATVAGVRRWLAARVSQATSPTR